MSFWNRFYNLCKEKNIKPNPAAKEIGISSGALTKWKNGEVTGTNSLNKIADYFGCSVDYLLCKTDEKTKQVIQNEQPVSNNLKLLIQASSNLSDEEIQKTREYVEFLKSQRK